MKEKLKVCQFDPANPSRVHLWFDTEKMKPKYGVQQEIGSQWAHAYDDSAILIFDTPADVDAFLQSKSE